ITVYFDLMIAVAVGILLSFILYIATCKKREVSIKEDDNHTYIISGPLSFLSVDRIFSSIQQTESPITLQLEGVNYMD
ncbi:hypothetical protein, partial [Streptococcus sobrinus]